MWEQAVERIQAAFPDVQAVYLFGSLAAGQERADSDVDLAVLLPPGEPSRKAGSLVMHPLRGELEDLLGRDVDLINLREVDTVFQMQIISANARLFVADVYAADEFEMLTLSYYGKLNEERREILEEIQRSGWVLQ